MTKAKLVVVCFYLGWLLLLVATPYFLSSIYISPALTGQYAYVALGLVAGILIAKGLRRIMGGLTMDVKRMQLVFGCVCAAVGITVSVLLTIPEWAGALSFVSQGNERAFDGPEWLWRLTSCVVDERSRAFVALSAGLGAFSGTTLLGGMFCDGSSKSEDSRPIRPVGFSILLYGSVALFFFLGFLRLGFWSPVFTGAYYSNWNSLAPSAVILGIPFALYAALVVCVGLWSVVLGRCAGLSWTQRIDCGAAYLMAFSLGLLLWNALTRCIDVHDMPVVVARGATLAVLLILISDFCLLYCLSRPKVLALIRGQSPDVGCLLAATETGGALLCGSDDQESQVCFEEFRFTRQESLAVSHLLQGKTSSESADRMGIKASTVRAYLQRAYKKAGVKSEEELKEKIFLLRQEAAAERCGEASHDDERMRALSGKGKTVHAVMAFARSRAGIWDSGLRLGALTYVLLLFLPPLSFQDAPWGLGYGFMVGGSAGIVGASSAGFLRDWRWSLGMSGEKPRPLSRSFVLVGCGLAIFVSSWFLLGRLLDESASGSFQTRLFDEVLSVAAFFLFFALTVLVLLSKRAGMLSAPASVMNPAYTGVAALAMWLLAWANMYLWQMFAVGSLIVLSCSIAGKALCVAVSQDEGPACSDARASTPGEPSRRLAGVLLLFCLGLSVEEVWRGATNVPLSNVLACLLVFVLTGCFVFLAKAQEHRGSLLFLPAAAAVCLVLWPYCFIALVGVTTVVLAMLAVYLYEEKLITSTSIRWMICSFGLGLLAGRIGMDRVNDVFMLNDVLMAQYGGLGLKSGTMVLCAVGALAVAGVAAASLYSTLAHIRARRRENGLSTDARRQQYYLMGRGLTESQTAVLLKIAEGYSGMQIAQQLHYSYGMVNSSRRIGYHLLKVHSRDQLIALLEKEASLS